MKADTRSFDVENLPYRVCNGYLWGYRLLSKENLLMRLVEIGLRGM